MSKKHTEKIDWDNIPGYNKMLLFGLGNSGLSIRLEGSEHIEKIDLIDFVKEGEEWDYKKLCTLWEYCREREEPLSDIEEFINSLERVRDILKNSNNENNNIPTNL